MLTVVQAVTQVGNSKPKRISQKAFAQGGLPVGANVYFNLGCYVGNVRVQAIMLGYAPLHPLSVAYGVAGFAQVSPQYAYRIRQWGLWGVWVQGAAISALSAYTPRGVAGLTNTPPPAANWQGPNPYGKVG